MKKRYGADREPVYKTLAVRLCHIVCRAFAPCELIQQAVARLLFPFVPQ